MRQPKIYSARWVRSPNTALIFLAMMMIGYCGTGQVVLKAGQVQSYNYRFVPSGFPCQAAPPGHTNSAGVLLTLDAESRQPGNAFLFEIVDSTAAPVASSVWSGPDSSLSLFASGSFYPAAIRLTGLTGSVTITSMTMPWSLFHQGLPPRQNEVCTFDGMRFVPNLQVFIRRFSSSQVQLSWTTNAFGYRLEAADSLPATQWSEVTPSSITGGYFEATVDSLMPQHYFRLQKP